MTARQRDLSRRLPDEPGVVNGGIEMKCECCRRLVLRAYGEIFIERQATAVCRDCAKHITAIRPAECEFDDMNGGGLNGDLAGDIEGGGGH